MPPALAIAFIDALPAAIASWRPTFVVSLHSPSRPMTRPWLPIVGHDREAMASMGRTMGPMLFRVGMPRAAMGHARPIALPMPFHVSALVKTMKAHGMAHGDAMGSHGARLLTYCHAGPERDPTMTVLTARPQPAFVPCLEGWHDHHQEPVPPY